MIEYRAAPLENQLEIPAGVALVNVWHKGSMIWAVLQYREQKQINDVRTEWSDWQDVPISEDTP